MLIPIWGASSTGKTTLALALSKALIAEGKTVLLISPEAAIMVAEATHQATATSP